MSLSDAAGPDAPDPYELLSWYAEMGVTEALDETPRNHFAEPAPGAGQPRLRALPGRTAPPARPIAAAATAPDDAAVSAKALAREARTLDELKEALAKFEGCALKATAKNLVFADGNPAADLMFVGEAPGRDEDERGLPFVGVSGQLLDRFLGGIGRDRTSAYIVNVLPWRPPDNREPALAEASVCLPFLLRHIALVRPRIVVALGATAARNLLNTTEGITRLRGTWHTLDANHHTCQAMATFHPAALLRQPLNKRYVWRDFLAVAERLENFK